MSQRNGLCGSLTLFYKAVSLCKPTSLSPFLRAIVPPLVGYSQHYINRPGNSDAGTSDPSATEQECPPLQQPAQPAQAQQQSTPSLDVNNEGCSAALPSSSGAGGGGDGALAGTTDTSQIIPTAAQNSHPAAGTRQLLAPRFASADGRTNSPPAPMIAEGSPCRPGTRSPVRGVVSKGARACSGGVRVLAPTAKLEAQTRGEGGVGNRQDGVAESKGVGVVRQAQAPIEAERVQPAARNTASTEEYLAQLYDGLHDFCGAARAEAAEKGRMAADNVDQGLEICSRTASPTADASPTATVTAIATATTTAVLLADAAIRSVSAGPDILRSNEAKEDIDGIVQVEDKDVQEQREQGKNSEGEGSRERNTESLVLEVSALSAEVTIVGVEAGQPPLAEDKTVIPVVAAVDSTNPPICAVAGSARVCSSSGESTAADASSVTSPAPHTTAERELPNRDSEETTETKLGAYGRDHHRPPARRRSISMSSADVTAAAGDSVLSRIDAFLVDGLSSGAAGHPGSPPPLPRRDIRKDYLTNLGMKRAVVAGPGGTRTTPRIVRRSSFHHDVRTWYHVVFFSGFQGVWYMVVPLPWWYELVQL